MKRLTVPPMLLVAMLVLAATSGSRAADKLNFSTTFKAPHYQVVPLAALEKDFFKQNGLQAEWCG